jgi:hypothetical protein
VKDKERELEEIEVSHTLVGSGKGWKVVTGEREVERV